VPIVQATNPPVTNPSADINPGVSTNPPATNPGGSTNTAALSSNQNTMSLGLKSQTPSDSRLPASSNGPISFIVTNIPSNDGASANVGEFRPADTIPNPTSKSPDIKLIAGLSLLLIVVVCLGIFGFIRLKRGKGSQPKANSKKWQAKKGSLFDANSSMDSMKLFDYQMASFNGTSQVSSKHIPISVFLPPPIAVDSTFEAKRISSLEAKKY